MTLQNSTMAAHEFLVGMYQDGYFPNHLVDRVKDVLSQLCGEIERKEPRSDAAMLALTHAATEQINELEEAFLAADSELETVAREVMAEDFAVIVGAYGFGELDIEDVIAPREW